MTTKTAGIPGSGCNTHDSPGNTQTMLRHLVYPIKINASSHNYLVYTAA